MAKTQRVMILGVPVDRDTDGQYFTVSKGVKWVLGMSKKSAKEMLAVMLKYGQISQ